MPTGNKDYDLSNLDINVLGKQDFTQTSDNYDSAKGAWSTVTQTAGGVTPTNDFYTGIRISATPHADNEVQVFVNGIRVEVGDGDKRNTTAGDDTADCYFSGDNGATARRIVDITKFDKFYWNAVIAGYNIDFYQKGSKDNDDLDFAYFIGGEDLEDYLDDNRPAPTPTPTTEESDIRSGSVAWQKSGDSSNDLKNSLGSKLDEFINNVVQAVTGGGMIPISVPKKEIFRILQEAKKWFYKNYEYAVQDNFYVIPNAEFKSADFIKKRAFKLPKARVDGSGSIISVYGVKLASGRGDLSGSLGSDFAIDKLIFEEGMSMGGVDTGEVLMQYVIKEKYYDMAKSLIQNPMSYNYNPNSHILKILGENPDKNQNLILEVYESISDMDLFEDEMFIRYVTAKVKKQLGSMLTTFDYTLPGNIAINGDNIKSDADEELTTIIEEIRADDSPDYFMHT